MLFTLFLSANMKCYYHYSYLNNTNRFDAPSKRPLMAICVWVGKLREIKIRENILKQHLTK
jgi:hypothetical protein